MHARGLLHDIVRADCRIVDGCRIGRVWFSLTQELWCVRVFVQQDALHEAGVSLLTLAQARALCSKRTDLIS